MMDDLGLRVMDDKFIARLGRSLACTHEAAQFAFTSTRQEWGSKEWRELQQEVKEAGILLGSFYDRFPDLRPVYGYDRDLA